MSGGMRPPDAYRGGWARFQRARGDPMPKRARRGTEKAPPQAEKPDKGQSGTTNPERKAAQ
jgi:hypothetical protein